MSEEEKNSIDKDRISELLRDLQVIRERLKDRRENKVKLEESINNRRPRFTISF